MNNVIFKTALRVLAALVTLAVIAYVVLTFCFPRIMGQVCKSFNNYQLSTWYYSLSFSYTGEVQDIATCVENSIIVGNNQDIVTYGDRLFAVREFDEYCTERDSEFADGEYSSVTTSYKQYIVSNVAISKYALGNFDSALSCATLAMTEDFPRPNALALLSLEAVEASDTQSAAKLLNEMGKYTPNGDTQTEYYNAIHGFLSGIIA